MDTLEPINLCFDHLGGFAGERLTDRLLELGWITPEPHPGVTPEGWAGLTALGLDLTPLMAVRRRPVAICTEACNGKRHSHLGGHLGALVRRHFIRQGWVDMSSGAVRLSAQGELLLGHLGVMMEERH